MRKLPIIAAALAAILPLVSTPAQAKPTYYYCWAYESGGGNRMWISPVSYGDSDHYTSYINEYTRNLRNIYNVQYFSAQRCGPFYENTNRSEVEDDRSQMITKERNNSSRNVVFH